MSKEKKQATFEVCVVAEYHGWVTYPIDADVFGDDPGEAELCAWAKKKILNSHNLNLQMAEFMTAEHVTEIKLESVE